MPRIDFTDLPAAARQAVTLHTGPVRSVRPAEAGRNSAVAAVLATASGPVFVKALPADHPQAAGQRREVAVAPHLPALAPRLLWHEEVAGWLLVAWEAVAGRHADYRIPGDLHLVRAALEDVQGVQAPAGVEVKTAVERWGPYADEGDAELFDGDVLLHTEWAPDDVLVAGRQVRLVDWAWPTRGAGWIDPYMWALRLMEAGHSAASAVEWACEVPSWRDGDPAAIRGFGAAVQRVWQEIVTADPAAWKLHMAVQAAELRAYLALEPGQAQC
ncbi:aminoglycoside phosphotransferase [Streptomyces werraensis]|uniref:aminoglycoside phosphotransferase n=1 Tax=Streptomyces werraensis TaxID=68284 RepID=UPI0037F24A3B